MSGFGIIAFDQLFAPVKASPVNADRLFGFDSEGNVNAAFTVGGLRQAFGGGDWNTMANRPSTFAPASHTLASHSDTEGLSTAPDGVFMAKVAGRWRGVVPDFARSEDIPQIGTHILAITAQNISQWNEAHGWGDHAGLYRPANWQPTWSQVSGKPSVFAPAPHTLASHSDADGLAGALVGQLVRKGETGWESWTPDYYGPENPAPPDATVPDFVRGFDPVTFAQYDDKLEEFADIEDGAVVMVLGGKPVSSGIKAELSENPYDPELEEEDYEAWEENGPEVESYTFTKPVKGLPAEQNDEFVTKGQVDQITSDFRDRIEFNTPVLTWVFSFEPDKKPSVETYDLSNVRIYGKEYIQYNIYVIEYSTPRAGYITLN